MRVLEQKDLENASKKAPINATHTQWGPCALFYTYACATYWICTIPDNVSTHLEKILPDFRYQIHELTLSLNVEIKLWSGDIWH